MKPQFNSSRNDTKKYQKTQKRFTLSLGEGRGEVSFCIIIAITALLFAHPLMAQERKDSVTTSQDTTAKKKKHHSMTISNKGIWFETTDSTKTHASTKKLEDRERQGRATTAVFLMDLGFNQIIDNTNYTDPSVQNYLNVPANMRNKSLFDLRTGKSVNVNIYPWTLRYLALKTHGQKIYISTGLGLQLYNFRFNEPLTYAKNPAGISLDTATTFKKDKLALDYLNVPLMFTFKTRLYKNKWLVYGAGISEGYRIASWNKQVSDQYGKVKIRGSFDLADFNTCLNAEFGIENGVRFYATYQLTSLYSNGIDQHPFSFGFKISGI